MQAREKVEKLRTAVFFQWFGAQEGQSRLAKAAGAEPSGRMRDEKLNTACSDHFWKLRCRKSARRCGTKHISKSKVQRTGTTFGSWDVEKAHAGVARSSFRRQKCKTLTVSDHFWTFRCRFAWQAQRIVHLVKSEQRGLCSSFKNDGRRGTCE
jgi:hypothetical protein